MKYIYYIKIGGTRGQYILFTSLQKANDYCSTHTTWTNTEILRNVKKLTRVGNEEFFTLLY